MDAQAGLQRSRLLASSTMRCSQDEVHIVEANRTQLEHISDAFKFDTMWVEN